jgi:4-aminobutyrate aminotransferase-like enzyme
VELEDEDTAEEIVERALRRGLMIGNEGEALTFFPPLTIDRATVEEGLDILESCL